MEMKKSIPTTEKYFVERMRTYGELLIGSLVPVTITVVVGRHGEDAPLVHSTTQLYNHTDDRRRRRFVWGQTASVVCMCMFCSPTCLYVLCSGVLPKVFILFPFRLKWEIHQQQTRWSGLLSGVGLAFLFGATSRVAAARDEGRPKENNRADPQKPKSSSALWLSEWIDAVHRLTFCAGKWLWGELWRRQRRQPNKENGIVWMISGQLVCYFGVRDMECNSIFQARQWAEKYEVATSYGVYGI